MGCPTFSRPAIVQRTMRAPKQTPLLTLKFHNEAAGAQRAWPDVSELTSRSVAGAPDCL